MKVAVIICAAGSGLRAGLGGNKALFNIGNMTLLERTLTPFLCHPAVSTTVVVKGAADKLNLHCRAALNNAGKPVLRDSVDTSDGEGFLRDFCGFQGVFDDVYQTEGTQGENNTERRKKNQKAPSAPRSPRYLIVNGGRTRSESVYNALQKLRGFDGLIAVHDAARPFITHEFLTRLFSAAERYGSAVPVLPVAETVKIAEGGRIVASPDRARFFTAQTPQVFAASQLIAAYDKGGEFTDDAALFAEHIGAPHTVEGLPQNVKLTTPADFAAFCPCGFIVGTGFDAHKLVSGRKLILGGVTIPHTKGLLGHSDADALCHAVTDAVLAAAGTGDIGTLFPDTDPKYKDADSVELLKAACKLARQKGFAVNNVSAVIMAEKPKLMPHINAIRGSLAQALNISVDTVALSATTTESLGFTGREEGIAVHAVCSLVKTPF